MTLLSIKAGKFAFKARLEEKAAPKTCAAFKKLLPFENQIVHVRWSGEGVWIPLGDRYFGIGYENHTSHPAPGHILFYPGGFSEAEIILAYGGLSFSSKMGQLAGNHFLTIVDGLDQLQELGNDGLWKGAQFIRFEMS